MFTSNLLRWRWLILLMMIAIFGLLTPNTLFAHANLYTSRPAANQVMDTQPNEIRLFFSEDIEPYFSHIYLQDSMGNRIELPPSQIDPDSSRQMVLTLDPTQPLPEGVYTVIYRVLSATDAHPTAGSFAFTIGTLYNPLTTAQTVADILVAEGGMVRWLNLLTLALLGGSLGFYLLVWMPLRVIGELHTNVQRRLRRLIFLGWLGVGFVSLFLLILQYAIATNTPLLSGFDAEVLGKLLNGTRFGLLWILRMVAWVAIGLFVLRGQSRRMFYWGALIFAAMLVVINSLFSHGAGAFDPFAAVGSDALHLGAMIAWVGGLLCFAAIMPLVVHDEAQAPVIAGRVSAQFTMFARLAVMILIVTGIYASWLQIGSLDGLLYTPYGRLMLLKWVLILPVMGIAAVNLVSTQRRMTTRDVIWTQQLRQRVTAEAVLTTVILAVIGVMTTLSPARNTLALEATIPIPPTPVPLALSAESQTMRVDLAIYPGWMGQNTFTVKLFDSAGKPITDAETLQLRFEHLSLTTDENELTPTLMPDGSYQATGVNLSAAGEWRISVQRSADSEPLAEFLPQIPLTPVPTFRKPVLDNSSTFPERVPMLVIFGVVLLVIGGVVLFTDRTPSNERYPLRWMHVFSLSLMLVGGGFIANTQITPPDMGHTASTEPRDMTFRAYGVWRLPSSTGFLVYFSIDNPTFQPDTLIGVEVKPNPNLPNVIAAMYETRSIGDGSKTELAPLEALTIAADSAVFFSPGVYHVAVDGVSFADVDKVVLMLKFRSGRVIELPLES